MLRRRFGTAGCRFAGGWCTGTRSRSVFHGPQVAVYAVARTPFDQATSGVAGCPQLVRLSTDSRRRCRPVVRLRESGRHGCVSRSPPADAAALPGHRPGRGRVPGRGRRVRRAGAGHPGRDMRGIGRAGSARTTRSGRPTGPARPGLARQDQLSRGRPARIGSARTVQSGPARLASSIGPARRDQLSRTSSAGFGSLGPAHSDWLSHDRLGRTSPSGPAQSGRLGQDRPSRNQPSGTGLDPVGRAGPIDPGRAASPPTTRSPSPARSAPPGGERPAAAAAGPVVPPASPTPPARADRFGWPLAPPHPVVRPFDAPASPYGPGHRGVDLGGAAGAPVLAAGAGVWCSPGRWPGRGVVSVDHPNGLRTTYEPLAPAVTAGQQVAAGAVLGHLRAGHAGCPARVPALGRAPRRGVPGSPGVSWPRDTSGSSRGRRCAS